jgi:hypothetical protein
LTRDLDCLPTIKSKAHHRLTKKTLTTQAQEGRPRSPSMRFARATMRSAVEGISSAT